MHDWSVFISGGNAHSVVETRAFLSRVIAGLWYVKWQPYYGKAFTAAETHSIGKSILRRRMLIRGRRRLDYAMIYFLAVWKAAVLG
ncbi:permease [Escherichia coli]|uniref:Permease n=1 Tax=Escherichia coli TaxID=562 RepID=A0A376TVV5_ECOLX|nr:permease [Escherichia coli]